jgi:hypothetical protein
LVVQINEKIDELQSVVDGLEKQITDLAKQLADRAPDPLTKSVFECLVAQEIARGCPASVAGARVLNVYGANPDASALRKRASSAVTDFMAAVDERNRRATAYRPLGDLGRSSSRHYRTR